MGFMDTLRKGIEKANEKNDRIVSDYVKKNADRYSDEKLLQNYANVDDNPYASRTRDTLRRELRRRGYDDLD